MPHIISRRIAVAGLFAAALPPTAAHAQPYPHDTLIVPGVRVGGVHLGMSVSALYALLGEPEGSRTWGWNQIYHWPGVQASVRDSTGAVVKVTAESNAHALATGLAVGMSELALRAQRPQFWRREDRADFWYICFYEDGLQAQVQSGRITHLTVFAAREIEEHAGPAGHWTCFRFEGGSNVQLERRQCRRR